MAHLLAEKLMLTSNSKFRHRPGPQDKLTAKRNFKFGVNINLSASRWATLYIRVRSSDETGVTSEFYSGSGEYLWNGEDWVWTESKQEQGIGIPFRPGFRPGSDSDDHEGSGIDTHVASESCNLQLCI